MPKMIFVNLPVRELAAAIRFYQAIGCQKNDQFSDNSSASMVWSETITFQLATPYYFATYTPKAIADAHATTEVLLALSIDSRQEVDRLADAAAVAGGKADIRERQDSGFMYNRAIADPDGHNIELMWMDMGAA
ncbi:VOC family protein [Pararhizobium qamdonense]|uniref:VOC family protein n=1 Tax=Pararhizobium qamdonense TaxID=3031126 RepID=UPI0023E18426|nr:VOC family protein [Pararhizobium qamdonense]